MSSPSGRALAVDLVPVLALSVGVCVAADALPFMSALVPLLVLGRFVAFARLPAPERLPFGREVALYAALTVLGAANDWSSVVRHRVYDYGVPTYLDVPHALPVWMLVAWGLVLRLVLTLVRFGPFAPERPVVLRVAPKAPAALAVAIQLALVLVTRQCIYRFAHDPLLSWLPFAVALAVWAGLFGLRAPDRRVVALLLVGGVVVESLYIQLGGLHRYALGWLGGVPLWIALWWVLGGLVLRDLGGRALALLGAPQSPGSSATKPTAPHRTRPAASSSLP